MSGRLQNDEITMMLFDYSQVTKENSSSKSNIQSVNTEINFGSDVSSMPKFIIQSNLQRLVTSTLLQQNS